MTGERGSATVLAVGAMGVLLALLVASLGIAAAAAGHRLAVTAADQAALVVAEEVAHGAPEAAACAAGAAIAARNRSRLPACAVVGGVSTVHTETVVGLPALLGGDRRAVAEARAGPAGSR